MKIPDSTSRIIRKSVTTASGLLGATRKSMASAPGGILESATEVFYPSTNEDLRAKRLRFAKLGSNLALGAAAGGLVAGPPGAIVGLAISFVQSTLANVTDEVSGDSERFRKDIRNAVQNELRKEPTPTDSDTEAKAETTEDKSQPYVEKPSLRDKLKALVKGAAEGVKSEFEHGKVSASARAAGFIDGLDYDPRIPKLKLDTGDERGLAKNLLVKGLRAGMGVIGAVLSLPGGLIVGSLEAIKGPEQDFSSNMKPLLRLSSGLGKAVIPGILGGIFAGPAGAAVATGAGLLFDIAIDGINTISDGKRGVNKSMYESIHDSLTENLSEEEKNSGYGVYYRAGKGAAVGAQVSLAEGWKRGYYGGVDAVRALIESPFQTPSTEADS